MSHAATAEKVQDHDDDAHDAHDAAEAEKKPAEAGHATPDSHEVEKVQDTAHQAVQEGAKHGAMNTDKEHPDGKDHDTHAAAAIPTSAATPAKSQEQPKTFFGKLKQRLKRGWQLFKTLFFE